MKIGIIGVGAMGQVIAERLLQQATAAGESFTLAVCELDAARRRRFEGRPNVLVTDKISGIGQADLVIIAVKPPAVPGVLQEVVQLESPLVASIAAGVTLEQLVAGVQRPVVRIMPNLPCEIGKGVSALAYSPDVTGAQQDLIRNLFSLLGDVVEIDESLFPAATALSGCGPAYVYLMIEALIDAGCAHGLKREAAKTLVAATFAGAAHQLKESQQHPAELKDLVTSPGGITIQALHVLEQKGIRGILWDAVNRAVVFSNE